MRGCLNYMNKTVCKVNECSKDVFGNTGYCWSHSNQMKKYGKILTQEEKTKLKQELAKKCWEQRYKKYIFKKYTKCIVPDCSKNACCNYGYCWNHKKELNLYGKIRTQEERTKALSERAKLAWSKRENKCLSEEHKKAFRRGQENIPTDKRILIGKKAWNNRPEHLKEKFLLAGHTPDADLKRKITQQNKFKDTNIKNEIVSKTQAKLKPIMQTQEYKTKISTTTQGMVKGIPKTSKYVGVYYCPRQAFNCWASAIKKDKKVYRLGYFDTELAAAMAYDKKALELYGENAKLNLIHK